MVGRQERRSLACVHQVPTSGGPIRNPYSPVVSVRADDMDHVFSEMEDLLHARDLIEDEEQDATMLEIFAPAQPLPGGFR